LYGPFPPLFFCCFFFTTILHCPAFESGPPSSNRPVPCKPFTEGPPFPAIFCLLTADAGHPLPSSLPPSRRPAPSCRRFRFFPRPFLNPLEITYFSFFRWVLFSPERTCVQVPIQSPLPVPPPPPPPPTLPPLSRFSGSYHRHYPSLPARSRYRFFFFTYSMVPRLCRECPSVAHFSTYPALLLLEHPVLERPLQGSPPSFFLDPPLLKESLRRCLSPCHTFPLPSNSSEGGALFAFASSSVPSLEGDPFPLFLSLFFRILFCVLGGPVQGSEVLTNFLPPPSSRSLRVLVSRDPSPGIRCPPCPRT